MKHGIAKSQFLLLLSVVLSGCASSGPPLPPSLELPGPVNDLRALRKGNRVYLAWTEPTKTTDHQAIRRHGPTLICRSRENPMKECEKVGEVPPATVSDKTPTRSQAARNTATYADNLPMLPNVGADDKVIYAVKVLNDRRRGAGLSNQVQVPLLPAIPPAGGFQAEVSAQGVNITWACPSPLPELPNVEYRMRVYRRQEGKESDEMIAEPSITNCQGSPLMDTSFEWEKSYDYRAAVVTVISVAGKPAIEIEGDDSARVRVVVHDVFPPAVPADVQAVFSGPGQQPFVDLIWSPDTDADLAGYNVYRREQSGQPAKLNSELIRTPAYRDDKVQSGKKYFYSVSAVDLRANESAKSDETSESVP